MRVAPARCDATGGWTAAIFLDAGMIACAVVLFVFVREASASRVLRSGRFDRAAVTEGARVT